MNSKAKRLLSWLCVLALCMSLLPMTALASGTNGNTEGTSTSSLSPASIENGDVKISKTATRAGEDTWEITMTVTAKEQVESEPLELVLLLDRSGSMAWCTHMNHGYDQGEDHHDYLGGQWCSYPREESSEDSRQAIAGNAAKDLIDQLVDMGVSASVSVVGFADQDSDYWSNTKVLQEMTALTTSSAGTIKGEIPTSGASGGTYMNNGLKLADEQFTEGANNKVIVLLADGDYNGRDPNGQNGYVSTLKSEGVTVHTIGFTTSNDTLQRIADTTGGEYYTADNAEDLAQVFNQIADSLTAMVTDYVGDDVVITGQPTVEVSNSGYNGNGTVNVTQGGKRLTWNPEDDKLTNGQTATIKYSVKLSDSDSLNVGENLVNLNGNAVLTYRVSSSWPGKVQKLKFPVPTDTVEVGQLTTEVMLDGAKHTSVPGEKVIIYGDKQFIWEQPEPTMTVNGTTYMYVNSTYDTRDVSNTAVDAEKGSHTLVHYYTSEQDGDPITIQVILDGDIENPISKANIDQYVTITANTANGDTYSNGTLNFKYQSYNCADVSEIAAKDGYVIEAITADLVYGGNGSNGIQESGDGYSLDNVKGDSTITVYVRTLYTAQFHGTDRQVIEDNTVSGLVAGKTDGLSDNSTVKPTNPSGEGYSKPGTANENQTGNADVNGMQPEETITLVASDLRTAIMMPDLPAGDASHTVSGWWLNAKCEGEVDHAAGTTYTVSAKDADGNHIIHFYSKSTVNTADYTVKYVFKDANGNVIPDTSDWTSDSTKFPQGGNATIGDKVDQGNLTPTLPNTVQPAGTSDNYFLESCTECTIQAGADNVITVTYALDNWDDGNDTETGGDGTPDYQQALIKYVVADDQESYGYVTPGTQVETLTESEGTYTGSVTASSEATANDGYAFDYWTSPKSETSWNATLSDTFTAQGGKTYTYTANFAKDTNEDGIPDKYQVFVNFVSANEEQGTVSGTGTTQVVTFGNAAEGYSEPTAESQVTPTLENVQVEAKTDYAFDIWTKDAPAGENSTGVNPAQAWSLGEDEDGNVNTTITFYANFAEDKIGGEEGGDKIPDKYQATVTYKIVGGTWSSGGNSDIQEVFTLKTKDSTTGQWVDADPLPSLGNTIPTDMTPDATHVTPGNWNTSINDATAVTENITYTYTFTTANPAISITKTASVKGLELTEGDTVDVGDTITYTLKVENTGNTDLTAVTVRDTMWGEGNVETIHVDGVPYDLSVKGGYWNAVMENGPYGTVDKLEPDGTWTCTYTYTVQDGDTTIKNTATVSTTDGGPDGSDTITIPVTGYDLSIDKVLTSVNGDPYQEGSKVRPGDVLTYTINVTNNNEETVTSFTVSDNLWQENQVETITIGAATADVTGGSYLFQGTLYRGDTWTCTYDYTVPEDVASVSNTAVINLPGDNDPDDTVTVAVEPDAPGLKVEKTLTQVNGNAYTAGSSVSVGDELTYTIKVTNNGNVDLTNVTVTDTMSNGRTVTWVNLPDGVTNENGTLTITSLAAGTSVELTATYKVLRADASSNLVNTAKVTGTNPGNPDTPVTDEVQTPETPVNPYHPPIRPPVDPDKPELNTEDHYAYIVGYEDGSVQPEGDITRAEVATIFFRLLTDESRNEYWSQTNPYSDVSADDWFNNAVSTLTNAGVLDGYEDGTFKPNGNITRAEFATIAVRFFEATYDGENLFPDIEGHWAQDYINEAANAGIVDGYPDGTFRPQQYITRAEAVTMVNRTIERHPDADHLLDDMITWPDNPETAWYYEQVQEATNSHTYTMHTDAEKNPYEIWSELLPVRDWAQLEKEWSDAHSGQTGGEVV